MEFNDFSWVFKSSNIKRLPCSLNMPYVRVCWRTSAYKFLFLMVVTIFHGFQLKKACIFNRVGIRMISSGIYNAQFIFQKKKRKIIEISNTKTKTKSQTRLQSGEEHVETQCVFFACKLSSFSKKKKKRKIIEISNTKTKTKSQTRLQSGEEHVETQCVFFACKLSSFFQKKIIINYVKIYQIILFFIFIAMLLLNMALLMHFMLIILSSKCALHDIRKLFL